MKCEVCGTEMREEDSRCRFCGSENPEYKKNETKIEDNKNQESAASADQKSRVVYVNSGEEPITIGNWIVTIILLMIPLVNIGYLIYLLVAKGSKSKSNLAKAYLCIIGFMVVIILILSISINASPIDIYKEVIYRLFAN